MKATIATSRKNHKCRLTEIQLSILIRAGEAILEQIGNDKRDDFTENDYRSLSGAIQQLLDINES